MTTHSSWGTTLLRFVCCLAVVLTIASGALAQPAGTVTKVVLKSDVLGEERTVLIRTPVGYETNKLSYPVLYMTDSISRNHFLIKREFSVSKTTIRTLRFTKPTTNEFTRN
ncbi:MAG TPA: hypothetical protein VF435_13995 [Pyrinomonadaceae bacterium]